jgi:hypothetical protein
MFKGEKMKGKIIFMTSKDAIDFILPRHYSGRKPAISHAFGWIIDNTLKAVVTYGKPASNTLCKGICGEENSQYVYELNRLCREDDLEEPLSQFVSATLRRLSIKDLIIVSYADSGANHNGYIYQATNFMYTGKTKERLQFHVPNGHSRHGNKNSDLREIRTAKHRYVFFTTKNKRLKKAWLEALNYPILPYPKEVSEKYVLGTILKPTVVNIAKEAK